MRLRRLTNLITRLTGPILLLLIVGSANAERDSWGYSKVWSDWATPPADSALEENSRIWIANETGRGTRFRIDILDEYNVVIRHFIDGKMGPGYLNVYWDRKDDTGRWVPAGEYKYEATIKRVVKTGRLVVEYQPEELFVNIYPECQDTLGTVHFDIMKDSLPITAGVYLTSGRPVYVPITDSLYYKGSYTFNWTNPGGNPRTAYEFRITAAGVTHATRIVGASNETE